MPSYGILKDKIGKRGSGDIKNQNWNITCDVDDRCDPSLLLIVTNSAQARRWYWTTINNTWYDREDSNSTMLAPLSCCLEGRMNYSNLTATVLQTCLKSLLLQPLLSFYLPLQILCRSISGSRQRTCSSHSRCSRPRPRFDRRWLLDWSLAGPTEDRTKGGALK